MSLEQSKMPVTSVSAFQCPVGSSEQDFGNYHLQQHNQSSATITTQNIGLKMTEPAVDIPPTRPEQLQNNQCSNNTRNDAQFLAVEKERDFYKKKANILEFKYLKKCDKVLKLQREKRTLQKASQKKTQMNKALKLKLKKAADEHKTHVESTIEKVYGDNTVLKQIATNMLRRPKGRRYTFKLRNLAIMLHSASPKAYRILSETFAMPTPRQIKLWLENIGLGTGINAAILQSIESVVKTWPKKDRCVTLCFDGTSLAEYLGYHAKSDEFDGLPDDFLKESNPDADENNKEDYLANHVVVFGFRGLNRNFKQVFGYNFVRNGMSADEQILMAKKCIIALRKVGIIVKAITLDQYTVNVQMFKKLGVTRKQPFFFDDAGNLIVCFLEIH